jgi:predicted flap endonuclease-1-like 5' DNA nuclease
MPPERSSRSSKSAKSTRSKSSKSSKSAKSANPSRSASSRSQVSDLPAIGTPATRVLASIGVTTRAQLASYTEADLLALHGFGPKGIAILRANGIALKK